MMLDVMLVFARRIVPFAESMPATQFVTAKQYANMEDRSARDIAVKYQIARSRVLYLCYCSVAIFVKNKCHGTFVEDGYRTVAG